MPLFSTSRNDYNPRKTNHDLRYRVSFPYYTFTSRLEKYKRLVQDIFKEKRVKWDPRLDEVFDRATVLNELMREQHVELIVRTRLALIEDHINYILSQNLFRKCERITMTTSEGAYLRWADGDVIFIDWNDLVIRSRRTKFRRTTPEAVQKTLEMYPAPVPKYGGGRAADGNSPKS